MNKDERTIKKESVKLNTLYPIRNECFYVDKPILYDSHSHDFCEVVIILNGSGKHRYDNKIHYVKRGDIYIIPRLKTHELDINSMWEGENIYFLPEIVISVDEQFQQPSWFFMSILGFITYDDSPLYFSVSEIVLGNVLRLLKGIKECPLQSNKYAYIYRKTA